MSEIKKYVEIHFSLNTIHVDGETMFMSSVSADVMKNPPDNKDAINNIVWDESLNFNAMSKGNLNFPDGGIVTFDESKYDDWIQPFVDLWQAEKDRLEQEQAEAEAEYAKFENRKERAIDVVTDDYHNTLAKGFVRTSLGFDADISPDSVATLSATNTALSRNVFKEETPKTIFRDFYGLKRELDQVQVELLICQINAAQNHIRELKYEFKTKIKEETHDNDSLNTALESCVYTTLDFTNIGESGKPEVLPFVQTYSMIDRIDARYR